MTFGLLSRRYVDLSILCVLVSLPWLSDSIGVNMSLKRLWGIEDDERELINECISQSLVVGLFVVNIYLINECI